MTGSKLLSEIQELKNQNAGLIEDHTRDVLSIKAKETQLVRARSDAEAAEGTNERLRRELDRLKRALSKAEAMGANGGPGSPGSPSIGGMISPTHDDAGIYRDGGYPSSANRHRMSFTSTLSEEKENGDNVPLMRNKFSSGASSGRGSPARGFRRDLSGEDRDIRGTADNGSGYGSDRASSRAGSRLGDAANGAAGGSAPAAGMESWKRAAEVTSQLESEDRADEGTTASPRAPARTCANKQLGSTRLSGP